MARNRGSLVFLRSTERNMLAGIVVRVIAAIDIIRKSQQIGRLQARMHDLNLFLGGRRSFYINTLPNRNDMMSCFSGNHFYSL